MVIFKKEMKCVLSLKMFWSLKIISFFPVHTQRSLAMNSSVEWLLNALQACKIMLAYMTARPI